MHRTATTLLPCVMQAFPVNLNDAASLTRRHANMKSFVPLSAVPLLAVLILVPAGTSIRTASRGTADRGTNDFMLACRLVSEAASLRFTGKACLTHGRSVVAVRCIVKLSGSVQK